MRRFQIAWLAMVQARNYGTTEEKMCLDGIDYIFTESFGSGSGKIFKIKVSVT